MAQDLIQVREVGIVSRLHKWLIGIYVSISLIIVIVAGLFAWIVSLHDYDYYVQTSLNQLALVFQRYEKEHGRLPPHAIYSKEGKALLSWRVILLPTMNRVNLYNRFRLDEPWDSPHNIKLLREIPGYYTMDTQVREQAPYSTRLKVFVGPGAAFEGQTGQKISQFPNNGIDLLLIVETPDPVPWTRPEDLIYDPDLPLPPVGAPESYGIGIATAAGNRFLLRRSDNTESRLRDWIVGKGNWTNP